MITTSAPTSNQHSKISISLILWFSVIFVLSLNHSFIPERGEPPLNLLITFLLTTGCFILAFWRVDSFRDYILKLDIRFLIMLHSWRMLGMGFIMLYMFDKLPPLFAFLAGFGDAATAITAVFLAYSLFTRRHGVSKKLVWRWNTFGLIDFIVAVSVGILTQTDALLFADNGINSDLMVEFPFALIPGFLVQVFTITHLIIYLQLRNNYRHNQYITI